MFFRSAPQRATITYATGVGLIPKSDHGDGFRDTTMLSYWGSVIVEANTTGFAMEFIGDLNDSTSWFKDTSSYTHFLSDATYGSGLNLQ